MNRYLITGGAGFIGSHIAEMLCEDGHQVVILDDLSTGSLKNIAHLNASFIKGSVFDKKLLHEVVQEVDTIYHLASLSWAPMPLNKTLEHMAINSVGTVSLLETARQINNCRVVCSSSEIANHNEQILMENGLVLPKSSSFYNKAKLDGEYYSKMYRDHFGTNTYFLNYNNVFGPRETTVSPYATVIPKFIKKALLNEPLTIYGDENRIYSFTYVKDVVLANSIAPVIGESTYDVTSTLQISLLQLANKIIDLCNSRSNIEYASEWTNETTRPKVSAASEPLDFGCSHSWDSALKQTIVCYENELLTRLQYCN